MNTASHAPVVVTGASGFVGRALVARLGGQVQALQMHAANWTDQAARLVMRDATLFHLAARVHDGDGTEADFMRDNAEKTRQLAHLAARGGARRFVLLSTIKVNGEETMDRPFTRDDPALPADAYARSKLAAEMAIREIAASGVMTATVVRSPLVYGRGARGNLAALVHLADSAWPLPFASLANRRSFIHVEDLASVLIACASSTAAAGRTYLVAHRESASTASLVTLIRERLGRPRRLFGVPAAALEAAAALCGQGERMHRLTRSLEVDSSAAQEELGWIARTPLDAAVDDLVAGCRQGARA